MDYPTWEQERIYHANGSLVAGVDEAGRGPLAGPVVAAVAVVRDTALYTRETAELCAEEKRWALVRDSKTLSPKQRMRAAEFVREHFHVATGLCDAQTIDRLNILGATMLAMKKAIAALPRSVRKTLVVLVDGADCISDYSAPQYAIKNGDGCVRTIAAASIIAKTVRDELMMAIHAAYPQYGFDSHKGYGTRAHMEAIARYGVTPHHRRSFKPIRTHVRAARQYGADV